jgi:hypothetical protein
MKVLPQLVLIAINHHIEQGVQKRVVKNPASPRRDFSGPVVVRHMVIQS